jgi:hypothetical protein
VGTHVVAADAPVFADPVQAAIVWRDNEALLTASGTEISEGQGSQVCVAAEAESSSASLPMAIRPAPAAGVTSQKSKL